MTPNVIHLLREHWSEVPAADEDAVHRAYSYATRATRVRSPWAPRARLAAAVAIAAIALGVAAGAYAVLSPSQPPVTAGGKLPTPVPVAGVAEADALLPFNAVLPSDPQATTTELNVDVKYQSLTGFFESPTQGAYDIQEGPARETVADLEQFAQQWKAGHAEVQLVDGVHVLIADDLQGYLYLSWIRGDGAGASAVETVLHGPTEFGQTFTKEQALSVAADLISHGG